MQTAGLKIKNTFERITNRLFMLLILALLLVFAADRISPTSAAGDGNVYIAGVPANFPPEYYVDADGKPYGFAIDFMNEAAQRSGIQIKYVVYDNFSDVIVALRNAQIDLIPILGITEERKAFTDFTDPVETFHIHIFVRSTTDDINNLDDLTGRKVAVVSENQGYVIMAERNGVDLLVYKSIDEALLALISGNADAMVFPDVPLILVARQAGLEERIKTTGESLAEIKRAVAVRKGQPELYAKLDEAVHAFILTPEYEKIYSKWYGASQPFWNAQQALSALGIVIALATAIFMLVHYILTLQLNRKLAKSLAEVDRTHATLQQWGHIIQHAQWGIAVSSSDGKSLAMMNPAFAAMHGFTIEELTGKPVIEVYAPQARPGLAEHIRIAHESGGHSFESLHIRKDGTIFPVQMNVTAVKDEKGELLYRVAYCQDITERKRAEAERSRLAQILEVSLNEIYIFDAETLKFSYANFGARQNTGYSNEQLQSMTSINLKTQFTETSFREMIRPLLLGEKKVKIFETIHQRANGTEYPVEVHLQLVESGGVRSFLALINDISERKQAQENMRQRMAELEALHTVSAALRVAQIRNEALSILLDEILAALETTAGAILLYQAASDELQVAVARGWFDKLSQKTLKPGQGIAGMVFASGESHLSAEYAADPLVLAANRSVAPAGWSGACLPISSGSITVGTLFISVPPPRQITSEQMKLLASLAEMAGATLHRITLHEETRHRLEKLQALHNIDRAITTSLDLRRTLIILLEQVTTQLKVDAASVLLLNPHLHTLEYAAGRGFRTLAIKTAHIRLGEGFAGRAVLERRIVQISDSALLGEDTQFATMFANEGFETYYGIPLNVKGQVKGVLEIYHRSPLAPDPEWLEFLETLAEQAAIAIDNSQLFDNLKRSNIELELAYDTTLEGWAKAIELRDQETEGHSQRVTEMTLRLARAMGIAEAEITNIRRGALLHDMGKMGVPDSILLKPGKLNDEEWVIMRKHPQYAYDMFLPITYLRSALDIPYCHHEKWDGTGYPRGLKGEQIPLSARIFAIIDVWDALMSDRPYRKAWPEKKVIAHIKAESGAHFDPEVVNAFLEMQLP